MQGSAVDLNLAAQHLHIGFARQVQWQVGTLRAVEQASIEPGIGVQGDRTFGAAGCGDQPQAALLVASGKGFLLVAGFDASHIGLDPNLKKMRCLLRRMVELAVLHTAPGAHALHVAGRDAQHVAHAVLVGELARQHVADDFHVAVAVGTEAGARGNAVFIDDAQIAPAHVLGVKVAGKRKTVERLEPAVVGIAPVARGTDGEQGASPEAALTVRAPLSPVVQGI